MTTISIRDLSRTPGDVLDELARSGKPTVVTRHGLPVAALVAIDEAALEDYILATAPEFVRSMNRATADLKAGRVIPATALFAGLDEGRPPLAAPPSASPRSPRRRGAVQKD
jgi:prevent-host-death family protein